MQSLAGLQIEPVDQPHDGLRRLRAQRLYQRPNGVLTTRCVHQNRAAAIKTETDETMTGQLTELAQCMSRDNEHDFFLPSSNWAAPARIRGPQDGPHVCG